MRLFIPSPTEDLEPRIMSLTVSGVFRIKRVGAVYFIEQRCDTLDVKDGQEVRQEAWKVVAGSKGKDAMREAYEWMHDAEDKVQAMIVEDMKRRNIAQPR